VVNTAKLPKYQNEKQYIVAIFDTPKNKLSLDIVKIPLITSSSDPFSLRRRGAVVEVPKVNSLLLGAEFESMACPGLHSN
jgi:hypothetical protein